MKTNKTESQTYQSAVGMAFSLLLLCFTGCATADQVTSKSQDNYIGWNDVPVILARIVPPTFPDRDFNITQYGAVADNATDIKPALDQAIAECHTAGGGRVLVPTGDWFIKGPIHLKSGVNLFLAAGATINFSTEPSDYEPMVFTRYEGTELMNYSPLIYAFEQENIAITGKGTFHGRASRDNWWTWRNGKVGGRRIREFGAPGKDNTPVHERIFRDEDGLRPVFVQPYRCRNILIEGVTFRDSPMWFLNPTLCENVTIRNVSTIGHGPNNDGCDPESSKDVLIEGCHFDNGDDCIAIKAGRDADGRRVGVPSENIIIRNCKMLDGHGGVVIGSEMSGGVRNVFAEDCEMDSPNLDRALRIKSNSYRGGFVENVHFRNVKVGQVADAVFRINLHYGGDRGTYLPTMRKVTMENVTSGKSPRAFYFHGIDKLPIQDVSVRDCQFNNVAQPDVMSGIENLRLINVKINGQPKE
jgi:polygalacturonase